MQLSAFENGPCTQRCTRSTEDHFICERYKDQIIPSKRKSINVMARCFSTKERQQRSCSAALSGELNTGEWLSAVQTNDAHWRLLSRVGSLKTWSCLPSRMLDATQTLNQITFTCTLNSTLNSRFLIKFLSAAASCDGSQQKHVCYWSPQLPNPITLLVIQKKELQKTHTRTRKHTHTGIRDEY